MNYVLDQYRLPMEAPVGHYCEFGLTLRAGSQILGCFTAKGERQASLWLRKVQDTGVPSTQYRFLVFEGDCEGEVFTGDPRLSFIGTYQGTKVPMNLFLVEQQ